MSLPLMLADAAVSAAPAVNPYLSVVLDHLLQLVIFLATPVLLVLAAKGVKYLEEKFGVDLDEKYEAKLQDILKSGVLRAGEWARAKVKAGEPLPAGAEKLNTALEFVKAELDRLGYDEMVEDKLKALIEAALAKTKAEQAPAIVSVGLHPDAVATNAAKVLDRT